MYSLRGSEAGHLSHMFFITYNSNYEGGIVMKELVGNCCTCKKEIYCLEGFLNGVVSEQGLLCFNCHDEANTDQRNQ